MKLVTFTRQDETRIGAVVKENKIVDLNYAFQALLKEQGKIRYKEISEAYIPADMIGFLQGGEESLSYAKEAVSFALKHENVFADKIIHDYEDVKIEAPLLNPGKII